MLLCQVKSFFGRNVGDNRDSVPVSPLSEIGLAPGSPVAWNLKDSEKFNEISVYLRRACCVLRINRRQTLNGQWADHNRTMGEPWLRPMLAFVALSVNKHRTHGESRVCYTYTLKWPSTVQTTNRLWTMGRHTVNPQRAKSEPRAHHGRTRQQWKTDMRWNHSEDTAYTTCWQHSRFEICDSSPDDGIQRAISFSLGKHDLRQWIDTYCT